LCVQDDDFASIVEGVRAGRTIFDNLAKTIAYTCSHLIPETIPTLLTLAFDFPAAIPSLAILAIDLGTELAPAISFAYEVSESDVMARSVQTRDIAWITRFRTLLQV
jgi:sodium/potassium-transporting ATPase subunit alpha